MNGGNSQPNGSPPVRLPVLMYHHVGPPRPGSYPGMTVTPATFERHIRWMAWRGYVGIRPSDWLAWRQGTGALPARPVIITLDDAYADIVEHALPVLERYGFGATVYVVTGQLGGTNTWDERNGWATHRLMTADQIVEWAGRGVEFGAHTRTHANLTTLSAADLHDEIVGSAEDLTQLLGKPPLSFAYPHGQYEADALALARERFALAFSVAEGVNHAQTDLHQLQRAEMKGYDTFFDFTCRLHFGSSPVRNAMRPIARTIRQWRAAGRGKLAVQTRG